MRSFKNVIFIFLILQLLFTWQHSGNTQQISKPVTYYADIKPLGDGIDWERYIPEDFEPIRVYIKFLLSPGTVEAEFAGNIIFDETNQTLRVVPRSIFDDEKDNSDTLFSSRFKSTGGLILKGEFVFNFELPIPFFTDITINHAVPIPGFPQIDKGWDEEKFFNSFLFGKDEFVQLDAGVRKILSADITVVEIAGAVSNILLSGGTAKVIVDKVVDIVSKYLADAGINFNAGLVNQLKLSGDGIYLNDLLTSSEGQTVPARALNPALDSYSIFSSYVEDFTLALDLLLSSEIFLKFAPFDIELWSYTKPIAEKKIPLIPEKKLDTLVFTTFPDPITFPIRSDNGAPVNRAPESTNIISPQTLRIGDAYTQINLSDKFTDPDNDILTYTTDTNNQGVLTVQKAGTEITLLPWSTGITTVTITATDPDGLAATQTFSVTVLPSTTTNRAPIAIGSIDEQSLYVNRFSRTINVSSNFSDPDGDSLTYAAISDNTHVVTTEVLTGSRIRITPEGNGSATVTVTANDGSLTATQTFLVNVSELLIIGNRAPLAQGTINAQTMTVGDSSTTINISGYFSDPDGDTLTYTVTSSDDDVVSVQRTGSSSIRLTPTGDGSATVTVTASDGSLSATQNFSVTVEQAPNDISDSPDLIIEDISADYVNNYPGERYTVSVTVKNVGGRRSSNVTLRYYHSSDATISDDDTEIENWRDSMGTFASGETDYDHANLDAPNEQGSYYIIARVDKVRNERNTRNNHAAIKITVLPPKAADLVVSLTAYHKRNITTVSQGNYLIDSNDYFKLIALVQNIGKADASNGATVRFYASTDATFSSDDEEIGTKYVKERQIEEGESEDEHYGLRAPENPGQYYYFACVDSVNNERETDNNCSSVVTINVRGPDLVIDSVSVDYWSGRLTTVSPNGIFELHATVLNQGTDEGSSSTLRYYVSSDATLSDDDTEFDTDWVHSLDPNEKEDEQSNTTSVNYVSGVFYCFVCIDEVEDELDTDNNCSAPIEIKVRNMAPRTNGQIPAQTLNVGTPILLDVSDYFTDANDDTLTYTANSNNTTIATASVSGAQVTIVPKSVGPATITVTANDGALTATQTISVSVTAIVAEETWMPDANLRAAVRAALGLKASDPLTQKKMTELTSLNADSKQIINLTGLEYATNLTSLTVPRNEIKVLTPLKNLTTLTYIDLHYNQVSDLTPLKNLVALTALHIGSNKMTNIASLKDLTELTELRLAYNNQIGDFAPLKNLTNLTKLSLYQTQISDLTPLENLTELTELMLYDNQISDIGPLKNLTDLTHLELQNNQISDVSSLEGLIALRTLYISGNPITDYAPLRRLKTKNPNLSTDITIPTGPTNKAPVAVGLLPDKQFTVGDPSVVLDVSSNFSDPDNDTLTYTVSSNNTAVVTASVSNSQVTITPIGPGNATITVTASDGSLTATQTIAVTVAAAPIGNRVPVAVGAISAQSLTVGGAAVTIDVSDNFSDADNDALTYTATSSNTSVATVNVSNTQVTITPIAAGSATITVTANDSSLTATQTISVTVTTASSEETWMPDAILRTKVRAALGLQAGEELTQQAMTQLTSLSLSIQPQQPGILNLTGLEHATQLRTLFLSSYFASGNRLSDITPLQTLTNLTDLNLSSNYITDITPLRNLTNLTRLILQYNQISDIKPLANLESLSHLSLIGNQINDITPIENLTSLTTLYLEGNSISDLEPLRRLKQQNLLLTIDIDIGPLTTNSAPVAVGTISSRTLTVGGAAIVVDVSGSFRDPDGDNLTYAVTSSNTSVATVSVSSSQVTIAPVAAGSATITVTASDGTLTATQNISITVTAAPVANHAPITVGAIADQTLIVGNPSVQVDVSVNFSDPDNDNLTYTVTSNNTGVATASVSGTQVTIAPIAAGNATITVTASDGTLTATQTISVTVNATVDETTWMPDAILRAAVRSALGLQASETLTQQAMTGLTDLSANGVQISNLKGLEHATSITSLRLDNNQISDLTSLQNLTELTYISLYGNPINGLTPLQNLTKLTNLYLGVNLSSNSPVPISDITPLQNLTKLTRLILRKCQISDITPLQNLTKLTNLTLDGNSISSLTPLQNLTELTHLDLESISISDITPLQNLTKLIDLQLLHNSVSDITPLQNLTKLVGLSLRGNPVGNITALQNLTELIVLKAEGCSISSITPLQNLTKMKNLGISSNQVSDITALKNLTELIQLDIRNNQISDVTSLESLTTLKILYISGNSITDYAPLRRLKANNPNMGIDITIPAEPTNNAPVAVGTISSQSLTVGGSSASVDVSGKFSDPDNDTLTYTASSSSTSVATVSVSTTQVTITPVAAGSATITVTASDGSLTATQTISVTVNAAVTNRAPTAVGTIPNQTLTVGGAAVTIDVSSKFSDPDNDTLTYIATSSGTSVATVSVSTAQVTITPVAVGSATITVTASDGSLTATQTISVTVNASLSEETWMPDANLRTAVRSALGLQTGKALTQQAMAGLTALSADNSAISDISGLEYATQLQALGLNGNQISDISALSGLTSLTSLFMQNNSISDISALSGLTSLTSLYLPNNSISDISAVSGLTSLTNLVLDANSISDISAVSGLTSLTRLSLQNNSISDISAVSGLTSLTNLSMSINSISDISVVSGLTSLTNLSLSQNSISDISAVSGLTSLTNLGLGYNSISDISAVSGLTSLTNLSMSANSISNISAVSGLTSLTTLFLSDNSISNISAVSGLTSLTNLSLWGNSISDVSALENLTSLTELYISGNQITDYGPLRRLQAKTTHNIDIDVDITTDPSKAPSAQANPVKTRLLPNYPNPFNPETWIPYQLAKSADVTLTIYNVRGVMVRQLALGHRAAGTYYSRTRAAHWDGKNNLGEKVAAGLYFCTLRAGDFIATRKMLIRK